MQGSDIQLDFQTLQLDSAVCKYLVFLAFHIIRIGVAYHITEPAWLILVRRHHNYMTNMVNSDMKNVGLIEM